MSVTIGGVEIGPGQPRRVIAELSNNHNGSLALAVRLIEECADAGADLVKFQCFTPDELVRLRGDGPAPEPWGSEGWTMRALYERAQTPHAWFPELVETCKRAGVPWFSSVFGTDSIRLLESLDCPAYKVAALDIASPLVDDMLKIRSWGVPVIASSPNGRVPWADLTLYCPPGYPQPLSSIGPLAGCDGFSYHGTDWADVLWAVDGQAMLEVHVQLDDVPSELESNVSLTISQLRQLCAVRQPA